ncbi:uroporphyrinogen-III C-methyltransferase [Helcobacillus massiliensis]|uniref:uroporphyrinogen-III C-methyltransferase n=1 Tax=Helcobacillus massiliensis TaxID=521392 RepID=A0A839QSB3_9MICO|nr:uroporphyrin-III C-methyltransferase [Helcobacillus massiliensis]
MRPTAFHLERSWQGRTVDQETAGRPLSWQAAQAFAAEGAHVILDTDEPQRRAQRFDALAREQGLQDTVLQWATRDFGTITIREEAPRSGEPMGEGPTPSVPGSVALVGSGPGDPELLTLAAMRAIAEADVIFADRLGAAGDCLRLAPGSLIVDVGKKPGHHSMIQELINDQMTVFARTGARVVRLKGGDPFIFGRGSEEWQHLAENGIRVDVVPGITSALAVPARAGIPATHRGITRAVTIISGHEAIDGAEAAALVQLGGSVMILMGMGTLPLTQRALLEAGLDPATPASVIHRGFHGDEARCHSTLAAVAQDAADAGLTSPSIIVIGEVAGLHTTTADITDGL